MTLVIDGRSGYVVSADVTDPAAHGIQVIRSTGTRIAGVRVHDCRLSGIRDFATLTSIERCLVELCAQEPSSAAGDSGILLQGSDARVRLTAIRANGKDAIRSHGIYLARPARSALVELVEMTGNAASGIKLAGGGAVRYVTIAGSVRGFVLEDGDHAVSLTRSRIAATTYAAIITSTTKSLARFTIDENTYAPTPRFLDARSGRTYDLAGWRKLTGFDVHSVVGDA